MQSFFVGLSDLVITRLTSGTMTKFKSPSNRVKPVMTYREFVWFLISDQDKKNETSMDYWFRVMDLDNCGFITIYAMDLFYKHQMELLYALDIEPLPFEDILCQVSKYQQVTKNFPRK